MSVPVRKFVVLGFPNEMVIGEVAIPISMSTPEAYCVEPCMGPVRLKMAIRMREVPLPKPGVVGVKIQVENPIVEFLPSDAKKVADVIKPAVVNTNLAHWVVEVSPAEFDAFLMSINAPTSLYTVPPGSRVPS